MDNSGRVLASAAQKILIGVFGLSDYEQRLVRSVLSLTMMHGRSHSYSLLDPASASSPDIAIVDPDNAPARASLRALCARNHCAEPAILFIAQSAVPDAGAHYLLRPLAPTKMLALLDLIAAKLAPALPPAQLPAAAPASAPATAVAAVAAVSAAPAALNPATALLRALIVDDSPTARISIELELRAMQVLAECASTGEQGLQMLVQKPYDLIFLDIVLPGADGYEICKFIRRNHKTKHIAVIMLTSKSSPFDRIRGSLAGCNSYLTKPVEHAKFHAVVEKCVAETQKQHATQHGATVMA